jgi:hypothetical protein
LRYITPVGIKQIAAGPSPAGSSHSNHELDLIILKS